MWYQMWHFDSEWTPCGSSSPFINKSWHIYCVSVQALRAQCSARWDHIPPYQPICWQICCQTSRGAAAGRNYAASSFAWIGNSVSHVHVTVNLCMMYIRWLHLHIQCAHYTCLHFEPVAHFSNAHIWITTVILYSCCHRLSACTL